MKRVCSAAEMRQREQSAVDNGVSLLQLMENAGEGAAADLLVRFADKQSILIILGKGNNAGDGLVMARILSSVFSKVAVSFVLGKELSELTQFNLTRLPPQVEIIEFSSTIIADYEIMVDAVFGTGFKGDLSSELQAIFSQVNSEKSVIKVALDIPSGINCDTGAVSPHTFQADCTYVFDSYKPAHLMQVAGDYCGALIEIDIGIK